MFNVPYTLTEGNGFRNPASRNGKTASAARTPIDRNCLSRGTVALIPGTHLEDAYEFPGGDVRGWAFGGKREFLSDVFPLR